MLIWEAGLDGKYICQVSRVDNTTGNLFIINENEKVIFKEEISLSFRTPFGPDINEIENWKEKCLNFIDSGIDYHK